MALLACLPLAPYPSNPQKMRASERCRKKAAPAAAGDPDTIREAVPDLVLSDEEEQILDRRLRSHSRRASSRPTGWTADSYPATELIFK